MKKNPSSKSVPTTQQANYVLALKEGFDELLMRVSRLEQIADDREEELKEGFDELLMRVSRLEQIADDREEELVRRVTALQAERRKASRHG